MEGGGDGVKKCPGRKRGRTEEREERKSTRSTQRQEGADVRVSICCQGDALP